MDNFEWSVLCTTWLNDYRNWVYIDDNRKRSRESSGGTINDYANERAAYLNQDYGKLASQCPNPEEICIKKDLLEKLSEPAKEVLRLIVNPSKRELKRLSKVPVKNTTFIPANEDELILYRFERFKKFVRSEFKNSKLVCEGTCSICSSEVKYYVKKYKLCRGCYENVYRKVRRLSRPRPCHIEVILKEVRDFIREYFG